MRAEFFGPASRRLLGIRHEPTGAARETALLICPSWGLEAMRTQRGLRQLGSALAAEGFEVLRFDYSGTGDSFGDARELGLADWLADIATAARELRESSGRKHLCLIGALLAAEAQRGGLVNAQSLVSIDAPEDGARFLDGLRTVDQAYVAHKDRYRARALPAAATDELQGFDCSHALVQGIAGLPAVTHPRLLWATTQGHAAKPPAGAESFDAGEPARWTELSVQFAPWTPTPMLRRLAAQLRTWLP